MSDATPMRFIRLPTLAAASLLLWSCGGGDGTDNAAVEERGDISAVNAADPSAVEMTDGTGEALPANLSAGAGAAGPAGPGNGSNGNVAAGNASGTGTGTGGGGGGRSGSDVGGDTGGNAGADVDGM